MTEQPKIDSPTPKELVSRAIEAANREVAAQPEWMRNILEDSAKPMRDTPREYVDNFADSPATTSDQPKAADPVCKLCGGLGYIESDSSLNVRRRPCPDCHSFRSDQPKADPAETPTPDESDLPGPRVQLPGYDIPARLEAIACYIDVLGHKLLVSTAIDCIAPHHATIHVNKPLLVVPAAKAETTSSEAAEKGPKVEG